MKTYKVSWFTDYCEEWDRCGTSIIQAESIEDISLPKHYIIEEIIEIEEN